MMSPSVLHGNGKILTLDTTRIMGILNVTKDSFFPGSRVTDKVTMIERAAQMISDGADILDLGAMSSRPGAPLSDPDQEVEIIQKNVSLLRKSFPEVFISVDTVWSKVADVAIRSGANMINDISAGAIDGAIGKIAALHNVPYVVMHMRGEPANMQEYAEYEDVTMELFVYFANKLRECQAAGIHQVILDPGIGFSKTAGHNFSLLKNLESFQFFSRPLLVGVSRKSFIYKSLETTVDEALTGTTVLHAHAISAGANLLRVHDVKEAKQAVRLMELLKKG